ncbi:RNA polymerase sigma factor [Streptomyces mobaraensis NBRC 13819 = DSM 40847]|uniref:RNA polymerase sigma factor n=1 Tax=Streptomyces mobaraensis (strain ATCC 29032 / DSM 40847 / JCM 4168 / NBRC 13819 / NCIMB 11159 / IPCR 16-22) TaxID=1223523 RepID=M3BRE9_STRM1|nr:RNA polymerase sigma factor [Streptomyces mobaraensis NBRC 13819 = DSM 40847]
MGSGGAWPGRLLLLAALLLGIVTMHTLGHPTGHGPVGHGPVEYGPVGHGRAGHGQAEHDPVAALQARHGGGAPAAVARETGVTGETGPGPRAAAFTHTHTHGHGAPAMGDRSAPGTTDPHPTALGTAGLSATDLSTTALGTAGSGPPLHRTAYGDRSAPTTADPATGPTAGPATDPTADPTVDPTVDPTADPATDPTAGPAVEPAAGPPAPPAPSPHRSPSLDPSSVCLAVLVGAGWAVVLLLALAVLRRPVAVGGAVARALAVVTLRPIPPPPRRKALARLSVLRV